MDWHAASGVASGVVALVATVPYIRAAARGEIRPSVVTWAGWWLFSAVVFAAQMLSEPSWSAILAGTGTAYAGVVMVLALRAGDHRLTALDVVCGVLGVASIVGWQLTRQPAVALVIAMLGDVVLCLPTIAKSLRDPVSEMGSRYLAAGVGSVFGILAARHVDFISVGWPAYTLAADIVIGG